MKNDTIKVLILDDDPDILFSLNLLLKNQKMIVVTEQDPLKLKNHLNFEQFDVALLDMNYTRDICSGEEGFDLLYQITEFDPHLSVVFMTAYGDIEKAVRALKEGAMDFILKPWQNDKLVATLSTAAELTKARREKNRLEEKQEFIQQVMNPSDEEIVGRSAPMLAVYDMIRKVAPTDANVLITGENGTGKELVARAIHHCSARQKEMFLSVDLGSIPESLFEAELFGYLKGSFTDAKKDKPGRFEMADKGTLFLDEIANMNLQQQSKLLTVLEKKEVQRIGANKAKPVDIRLICATNEPLNRFKSQDHFRKDLLFRINTVEIHLPPLRERKEDIPLLISHYLENYKKKYHKPELKTNPQINEFLTEYHWPGNIRELQHAMERAVILTDKNLNLNAFLYLKNSEPEQESIQNMQLADIEKNTILQAIEKHKGNISLTAKELGLTRSALYRRLEKYGI